MPFPVNLCKKLHFRGIEETGSPIWGSKAFTDKARIDGS
jgi:hypothetical protein